MSKVSIEESTLSAIGNAIREKTGESALLSPLDMPTAIGSISGSGDIKWPHYQYSINYLFEYDAPNINYPEHYTITDFGIDNFPKIKADNIYEAFYCFSNNTAIKDKNHLPISIHWATNAPVGVARMFQNSGVNDENIKDAHLEEIKYIKGNSSNGGLSNFLYQAQGITNFEMPNLETIDSSGVYMGGLNDTFFTCRNLERISFPKLSFMIGGLDGTFTSCDKLKMIETPLLDLQQQLPSNFTLATKSKYAKWGIFTDAFHNCYSLKRVPQNLVSLPLDLEETSSSSYKCDFQRMYNCCYNLETAYIPVCNWYPAISGDAHGSYLLEKCQNLRHIIYQTNSDGSPITAKYKSQTLSIPFPFYWQNSSTSTKESMKTWVSQQFIYQYGDYNLDKIIYNQETYDLYKDDPQALMINMTYDIETHALKNKSEKYKYSWYGHDALVETINTLPDCSIYGGNTISVYRTMGDILPGGGCGNLTEEEIAVATAKGWTIALKEPK